LEVELLTVRHPHVSVVVVLAVCATVAALLVGGGLFANSTTVTGGEWAKVRPHSFPGSTVAP
jgi:hypothetical protein